MPDIDKRTKAFWIATAVANLAVDILLPTLVFALLAPTGLPATLRLALGGTLIAAKAMGGRIETGQFRWRFAAVAAVVPTAAIIGCHLAGRTDTASMVAGPVAAAAIVVADLARNRFGSGTGQSIDGFAVLVLAEVVAGIVLTSISGDPRFVLARSSFYLALAGAFILATTWTRRPLIREALKPVTANGDPRRGAAFDRLWDESKRFRRIYRWVNASLGAALLADAAVRTAVIYGYPADEVGRASLMSQLPFVILIGGWFLINRGLVIPRAVRLLDAEMSGPAGVPAGSAR
ncbi:VC0807 family protein [Nocardia mexicana]|uniref:Uncharacterized protein n=1 Tax=Nocardia mexicana TaxID=279262 RepID=A0A370H5B2_9NOCA|nr:VC0807 family protein [Nocardia mexicana]RDI49236.1 hypothetical protein DFR68_107364 [Nocardia mexicana]